MDRIAAMGGVLRLLRRRAVGRLTVLMYHKVLPDSSVTTYPLRNLVVRESLFRSQLRWLAAHARVVPLGEALRTNLDAVAGSPLVSLTFDDGYRDNADVAAPVLEEFGLRGTFFVTTDFVGGSEHLWFDEVCVAYGRLGSSGCTEVLGPECPFSDLPSLLGWMKGRGEESRRRAVLELTNRSGAMPRGLLFDAMSPHQVRALHDAGHEIGSHTRTHAIVTQLDAAALSREIGESREQILDWTGAAPDGFCFPNGDFDEASRTAVQAAGYRYACTTLRGTNDRGVDQFRLRRTMVAESSTALASGDHVDSLFAGEVYGLHGILRSLRAAVRERSVPRSAPQ